MPYPRTEAAHDAQRSCAFVPLAPAHLGGFSGARVARASVRAPTRRRAACVRRAARMSADADAPDAAGMSLREELRMLLDPSVSPSAKSVLAQDLAKRAPQRGKEAVEEALNAFGLDGIPAVAQQVREDIVPDLARNGPRYVSELGKRVPDALSDAAATVRAGGAPPFPASVVPPGEILSTVGQELRNVFNKTPEGIETPSFEVVEERVGYQLRRYSDMLVVSTQMESGAGEDATEVEAATAMGNAFGMLAKYLFGKNTSGGSLDMTTPVIMDRTNDYSSSMSFIVPSEFSELDAVPQPTGPVSDTVAVSARPGGLYAVSEFTGFATAGEVRRQQEELKDALIRDGVRVSSEGEYSVMIYNGPSTLAFRRKNELCLPVLADVTEGLVEEAEEGYVEIGDTTD